MKKAAEADAFEALVAAHNKFSIAYSAYTTEVDAYNKKVEAKETALAVALPPSSPSTPSRTRSPCPTPRL